MLWPIVQILAVTALSWLRELFFDTGSQVLEGEAITGSAAEPVQQIGAISIGEPLRSYVSGCTVCHDMLTLHQSSDRGSIYKPETEDLDRLSIAELLVILAGMGKHGAILDQVENDGLEHDLAGWKGASADAFMFDL